MPAGKIGFFDSGLGGLGILRHVADRLPQFDYVYLGDTAHKPYGPRPPAEVRGYVQQAVSYLFDQGCELVIIASNTASSQALRFIQQQFLPKYAPNRKVLGIIVPAAEMAATATKNNRIGVLGAQGTVDSRSFAEEIQKLRPEATVYQQAAPELVSLIEAGLHQGREMHMMIHYYLRQLIDAGIDTLIPGCTQYALVHDQITEVAGPSIIVVSEGLAVAEKLQEYLARHSDLSSRLQQGAGSKRILFTANVGVFAGLAQQFYGSPVTAEQVILE